MVGGTGEQRKYTVKPQPNVGAEKSKYYRQVSVQLSDSIKGLLHVNLVNGITSFGALTRFLGSCSDAACSGIWVKLACLRQTWCFSIANTSHVEVQ